MIKKNTLKILLQYPNNFKYNACREVHRIHKIRKENDINNLKQINAATNAITTTIEKNLCNLSIKFVTTTSKSIRDLVNTKKNNLKN